MDQILDKIMVTLVASLKKEGKHVDATTQNIIRENLKNQISNLPEDKRNEVLGLIATQLK